MLILNICIAFSLTLLVKSDLQNKRQLILIFKPLTIVLIFIYALLGSSLLENSIFSVFICLGLFFSIFGDTTLMFEKKFKLGMIFFLLTHLCYLKAIYSIGGFYIHWSVIYISCLFYIFYKKTLPIIPDKLKAPVLIYVTCILFLIYQANASIIYYFYYYLLYFNIGIVLFAASDWILIIDRYNPLKYRLLKLPLYFIGQWFIAYACHIR